MLQRSNLHLASGRWRGMTGYSDHLMAHCGAKS